MRRALIVQTDQGNTHPNYTNTIVVAISTAPARTVAHVKIQPSVENGLRQTSTVKCEQIITISKSRLQKRIGQLDAQDMALVDYALRLTLTL